MNAQVGPLVAASKNPWLTACIALFVGFLAGLISPQSEVEREFLKPLALRARAGFTSGVRALADRTIAAALGRR